MQKETVKILIRRSIFAILIVICAILQNTEGYFPTFFGVRVFLLIPLTALIAMFEGELSGACFGLFAGALWDFVRGGGDGYNTLFLFLIGAICGILVRFLMQKNIVTALFLSGSATLIYVIFYVMFFISAQGISDSGYLFVRYYLPSFILSTVLTFVFYPFTKYISKKFTVEY